MKNWRGLLTVGVLIAVAAIAIYLLQPLIKMIQALE
jgi:hypothetical protein